jgi:hypothetical protein
MALTKPDAAQIDMTEFFDFSNPAWMTPPNPPAQTTSGARSAYTCRLSSLRGNESVLTLNWPTISFDVC